MGGITYRSRIEKERTVGNQSLLTTELKAGSRDWSLIKNGKQK
ncbi:hypothetical protein [Neobacillus sp. Marseille-QA0830]